MRKRGRRGLHFPTHTVPEVGGVRSQEHQSIARIWGSKTGPFGDSQTPFANTEQQPTALVSVSSRSQYSDFSTLAQITVACPWQTAENNQEMCHNFRLINVFFFVTKTLTQPPTMKAFMFAAQNSMCLFWGKSSGAQEVMHYMFQAGLFGNKDKEPCRLVNMSKTFIIIRSEDLWHAETLQQFISPPCVVGNNFLTQHRMLRQKFPKSLSGAFTLKTCWYVIVGKAYLNNIKKWMMGDLYFLLGFQGPAGSLLHRHGLRGPGHH